MPRKKLANQEELLAYTIKVRVNKACFDRLKKLSLESDCRNIAEVARRILSGDRINCFYRDVSLNAPMEELALIRKELKAIGVNINQQTKYFHQSRSERERLYFAGNTAKLYQQTAGRVDELLAIVSQLAQKWLQRSSAEKA